MRRIHYFLRGRLFPCAMLAALAVIGCIALAVWLPELLAPVALLERAFSFAVAIAVIASRELPERKIAKLVLLFVPWLGAALALFFLTAAPPPVAGTPPDKENLFSRVASLTKSATKVASAPFKSVKYCAVGEEMGRLLIADLKSAKVRIWLEYYILAQGAFLGDILALLQKKVADGVDIRLIFDDFGCSFTLPRTFAKTMNARGIKTAVFRRLRFGKGFSERDHRKIAVIDDICYTGGINLADEYIGKLIRFGHWKDSAVRIEGAAPFAELFLRTWCDLTHEKRPEIPELSTPSPHESSFYTAVSDTTAGTREGVQLFSLLFANAAKTLYLFTPYLSLPSSLLDILRCAAAAGTDVRVMIPHIPDKKAVFFVTRAYARELMRMGVKVREYTAGFLHAKSVVADGRYVFVGSYNLDFRSLFVQAECGAFFDHPPLAQTVERDFLTCWEQGTEIKRANAFVRFLGRACMLFAPLT